jgi:hypothetical protein
MEVYFEKSQRGRSNSYSIATNIEAANMTGLSSINGCWDSIAELKYTILISINILK